MTDRTRVNFHCHSDLSDGVYPPETLAAMLARDGIRYAALTDHDSIDGWERFSDILDQKGVGSITGAEITARLGENEIHLLAYGFNSSNPELRHALHNIRKQRRIGLQTVFASLRTTLKGRPADAPAADATANPRMLPPYDCAEIIRLVHDAGGIVFMAHPYTYSGDIDEITRTVRQLKEWGLDGIEVYTPDYSSEQREKLQNIATEENMLVSGGTDLHGPDQSGKIHTGIDMPTRAWKDFRNAMRQATPSPRSGSEAIQRHPTLRWKQLAIRFGLPALLTIILFLIASFALFIPVFEANLMEGKRETVRELTALTVNELKQDAAKVQAGLMTTEEAQKIALERLRQMRYGAEDQGYFWVIDKQPRMLMHPHVKELEGQDLQNYEDKNGKKLFVESVNSVKGSRHGEGYVEYTWQYNEDQTRIEPKISHVRLFKPWGWIVGTGIYIDDVQDEIADVTESIVWIVLAITALVCGLLIFVVQQSLRLERLRSRAEGSLRESHEKYRLLVETATEGTLLLLDGKCVFANRAMLDLLDYRLDELPLLDWHDLVPDAMPEDHPTVRHLSDLIAGRPAPLEHAGSLRRKNGDLVAMTLTCQVIDIDDRHGLIIAARDAVTTETKTRGVATDSGQKALLDDLQSSLLFLNEPLEHFRQSTDTCGISTPIGEVARGMTSQDFSAMLVASESGQPIGIITDGDLRRRVLAKNYDPSRPVHEVMSSPLLGISESSLVHEALLMMTDSGVRHLVLRDVEGNVSGIVRGADLLAFHRYASTVIVSEIERADSLQEVVEARGRLPEIVTSLVDVSARPRSVIRLLASVHDVATNRLLRMAMDQLGPPPVRFAFIAMGSQGRGEETLITDQDNGIIYEDVPSSEKEKVHEYFLALGDKVCQWLDAAGYSYCSGGVMARSSDWCSSLSVWQDRFKGWIAASEPKDILHFDMCFDFRSIYGADELARTLRQYALDRLERRPETLCHFASNTLLYKPPLGFFGKIVVEDAGEQEKVLDIKKAMMPIVKFARIYALRHKILQTNTIDRLDRMLQLDLLSATSHGEIVFAYEYMTELRLQNQTRALAAGAHADNLINPKAITHIEETTLREALAQVALIQKRIGYDFLGGPESS